MEALPVYGEQKAGDLVSLIRPKRPGHPDVVAIGRLALTAFHTVLVRKQSKYGEVLMWLQRALARMGPANGHESRRVQKIAMAAQSAFGRVQY